MKHSNRRIRLVLAVFAVAFAAMFVRAAWLQGVRAGSYEALASGQHKATIVDHASRGTIFDRTGVQLAIGRQATTVYANPRQIQNPQATAELVARVLRLDPEEVLAELSDRSHGFVYVARKADPLRVKTLKEKASSASASPTKSSGSIRSATWRRKSSATRAPTTTGSPGSSSGSKASSPATTGARR